MGLRRCLPVLVAVALVVPAVAGAGDAVAQGRGGVYRPGNNQQSRVNRPPPNQRTKPARKVVPGTQRKRPERDRWKQARQRQQQQQAIERSRRDAEAVGAKNRERQRALRERGQPTPNASTARLSGHNPLRRLATVTRTAATASYDSTRLHLGLRVPVATNVRNSREAIRTGHAADAARAITKAQLRNPDGTFIRSDRGKYSNQRLGAREQFALWRTSRLVRGQSRMLLEQRAEAADLAGVEDAVSALDQLERAGTMGAFARWRAGRAVRGSFRQTAINLAARGDFGGARQALARAYGLSSLQGPIGRFLDGFRNHNAAVAAYDQAMALATRYAGEGRPDLTADATDFGADVAVAGHLRLKAFRHQRRANKLVTTASRNLVGLYLEHAQKAYRAGDIQSAVFGLLAAREVPVERTRRQRRLESRLTRQLGSNLDNVTIQDFAPDPAGGGGDLGDAATP